MVKENFEREPLNILSMLSDAGWGSFSWVERNAILTGLRAKMEELEQLKNSLRLIRDERCECGGRFKWTGNQLRCEQCNRHEGYGYGNAREIAKKALNE